MPVMKMEVDEEPLLMGTNAFTLDSKLGEGGEILKELIRLLRGVKHRSKLQKDVWEGEITKLKEERNAPPMYIAVCGDTGAGKSSLLNALLDDNIAPTSGIQACTSVAVEISYHPKKAIEATIPFISENEWRAELAALKGDVVDELSTSQAVPVTNGDGADAWHKIHSVYPTLAPAELQGMSIDDIIASDKDIRKLLGTETAIQCPNSASFREEIRRYIGSEDRTVQSDDLGLGTAGTTSRSTQPAALWPLIRVVAVKSNAKVLQHGAVLVDLPGINDANNARNAISKEYLKKANFVWIATPMKRAISSKVAKDLMGESFRANLMNGNYTDKVITLIATQIDDVEPQEIVDQLHLTDDQDYKELQKELEVTATAVDQARSRKQNKEDAFNKQQKESRQLKFALHRIEHAKRANPRRSSRQPSSRRIAGGASTLPQTTASENSDTESCSDEEDHADTPMIDALIANFDKDSLRKKQEAAEKEWKRADKSVKSATKSLDAKKGELTALKAKRRAFCIAKRSKHSIRILQEDFREGIKFFDEKKLETDDPGKFDPTQNTKVYETINLPVFRTSSRAYLRMQGQLQDGETVCFANIEETGISALRQWCHQLTAGPREEAAEAFFRHLISLFENAFRFIKGSEEELSPERADFLQIWFPESATNGGSNLASRLEEDMLSIVQKHVQTIRNELRNKVEFKCRQGAQKAATQAISTSDGLAGRLRWNQYRCLTRLNGRWKNDNLNDQLTTPFKSEAASTYAEFFDKKHFDPMDLSLRTCISQVLEELVASAPEFLRQKCRELLEMAIEDAGADIERRITAKLFSMIRRGRKDGHRVVSSFIESQLEPSYRGAAAESGTGSFGRSKAIIHDAIDGNEHDLFFGGVEKAFNQLEEVFKAIDTHCQKEVKLIADKVALCMSAICKGHTLDQKQKQERAQLEKAIRPLFHKVQTFMNQGFGSVKSEPNFPEDSPLSQLTDEFPDAADPLLPDKAREDEESDGPVIPF